MKFRQRTSKLYAFALASIFALALAGCGGGGGGGTTEAPPDPPPMPTPQEQCENMGGRWNTDMTCTSAADLAQEMIDAAQMAAAAAAAAANDALNAAKAAVDGVGDIQSYDTLHYTLAGGALDDARRAKQAADTANQAAMDADTPEAAQAAQADAEQARADAEAALALANGFVQAIKDAKAAADEREADRLAEEERQRIERENAMKISDAQEAARLASVAASEAATAAATALATLQADADATAHQLVTATTAKIAADAAAQDAANAYAAAMSADTVTAAESARDDAQMAQSVAEAQKGIIDGFNMANQDNRDSDEAERQRMAAVNAARTAAMGSVETANTAASNADAAATRVEEIAAGTPAAISAREAADAAQEAANAAQAALAAITDNMTKDEADAQAGEAARQATAAQGSYMTASNIKDTTETNLGITQEENRKRDVAAAMKAANDAANAAEDAAEDADEAATAAETARDKAKEALDRATDALTDTTEAQKQYEAAKAAAMMARTAATNANTAYMAAKMAAAGIDAAGSTADAQTAQGTAEDEQGNAEDELETAEMQQGLAKDAEEAAVAAEGTHVLGLFKMANAVSETDMDDQAAAIKAVATAIGSAAGTAGTDVDNDGSTTGGGTTTTATASWPGDTPDDPDTDDDESVMRPLSITVTRTSGSDLVFRTKAAEEDDANTTEVDETVVTATMIDGLGDFTHGYSISDRGTHAIVFTDKVKGKTIAAAVTAIAARSVNNAAVQPGELAKVTSTANTITGVEWTPSGEPALTGTLSCTGDSCSITLGPDGTVTAITGYTFTGSRAARAAADEVTVANSENADYLVFGFWLQEDSDTGTDGNQPAFAAFFNGSSPTTSDTYGGAVVTGTAVYEGSATGVYTAGSSVDYFHADATLNADFGAIDTDAEKSADTDSTLGTITGMIHNIVAGGVAMSDAIHLNDLAGAGNISATGGFSGDARMGTRKVEVVDNVATVTYPYNGIWRGQFYNGTADDTDTADVNESHAAPGSAAGTFGVTGTDNMGTPDDDSDDVIRSFVGAFGAHKQ